MYDSTSFSTYLEATSEKSAFVEKFQDKLSQSPNRNIRRLADIGCHDGALTIRYLNSIEGFLAQKVQIDCYDPSEIALDRFRIKTKSFKYSFSFLKNTIEDLVAEPPPTYDWIIASHCLYWTQDLAGALQFLERASRNAVVVLRDKIGIYEIQKNFKHLLGDANEKLYCGDDIEDALLKLGIRFQREKIRSSIELPGTKTPAFVALLAFFLQSTSQSLAPEDLLKVEEFLAPCHGRMNHDVSFFWIGETL